MRRRPNVVQDAPAYLVQLRDRGYVQVADVRNHLKELLDLKVPVPIVRYNTVVGVLAPMERDSYTWSGDVANNARLALLRAARELKKDP